ncbi:ribose 5-phosphate isomerase B [Candidatus Gastranaerophilus sp. (ex Termes propinquus)]|nr:ribose 5-phosphate isomerase B [Candidatus Gastranaerophilus sp. (ex Termes propinquus)]
MENKIIALGSDHAGFELKEKVLAYLKSKERATLDLGTNSRASCDYPLFAKKVADTVLKKEAHCGILICGTGLGMAIAANRVKGIRAVCVENTFSARASREHNDSNILCLGARVLGESIVFDIIDNWLTTPFEGGRHINRIDMFEHMDIL